MNVPNHLTGVAGEVLNAELNAALVQSHWAVVYKLVPYQDGNQWCVLLGENIQEGVCGFGDSPAAAIENFDTAMYAKIPEAKPNE